MVLGLFREGSGRVWYGFAVVFGWFWIGFGMVLGGL